MKTQKCKECGKIYPKGYGYHRELCGACYIRKYRAKKRSIWTKIKRFFIVKL